MMQVLRKLVPHEEFDYQVLLHALKEYGNPRDKITDLLRKGAIIRVKKGLYIFGEDYRQEPYSREVIANLIYGPSYISLEYALQYYGMIPEGVEAVTSVTCGRSRKFYTPVGLFTYWMIPLAAFRTGLDKMETADGRSFLMAIPEKALADKIRHDRGIAIRTRKDLQNYILEDLRMSESSLQKLSPERLAEFATRYRSRKILLLRDLVYRLKRREKGDSNA
ncbi:MAG: hypothetical protein JRJ31_22100 [Deltaproteobacteria bacterium]|nr:hypothetical protein [Deltaproteobacteria bacterium]